VQQQLVCNAIYTPPHRELSTLNEGIAGLEWTNILMKKKYTFRDVWEDRGRGHSIRTSNKQLTRIEHEGMMYYNG